MADVTPQDITGIQLENMKGFDRVNADILKAGWENTNATKDARFDINTRIAEAKDMLSSQVDAIDDTLTAQIFGLARDGQDNKAQIQALGFQVRDGFVNTAKDAEINALKTQIELAKQTTYMSDKIDEGNERTRALINDLRDRENNRHLIEREAALIEERHERRHYRGLADQFQSQGQWAALQSQLQAFQSQLQTATQGTVNFGTMSGNAGRNTSTNNVV